MNETPAVVIAWITKHSRENLWKVAAWYDFEDLVHDGLMIALHCRQKLGPDVLPAQYVAYVKRAFSNHIVSLIRQKSVGEVHWMDLRLRKKDTPVETEAKAMDMVTFEHCPQEVSTTLSRLPENIRKVLTLLSTEEGRKRFYAPLRRRLNGPDETEAERLFQLVGWPKELSFEEELRELVNFG